MLLSLGLLFLVGMAMASICQKIKLPRIIGMLVCGIAIGPYALDLLAPELLDISAELRQMALIIILIKAGLSLNIEDLKKVGRPAILMAFLPASFEIFAYFVLAPIIFGISHVEALLMGAVLAAVSPAIVVPRMVELIEKKYGTKKGIPQLILAGASGDDVFVIVLFTTFIALVSGQSFTAASLMNAPISIVLGIAIGSVLGLGLAWSFEQMHKRGKTVRNSAKVVIFLGISFIVISAEPIMGIPFSGLLAIVSMACVYKLKVIPQIAQALAEKFGRLWIAAEIVLFVLVGAAVDTSYLVQEVIPAMVMVAAGLVVRSIGVMASLLGTHLNYKERWFCVLAYLPKATVQAAIGAVPLSLGLACGSIILTVAVFSIILTAPLGAIAIDCNYKKMLQKEE